MGISCMAINHDNGVMYSGDSDGVICMWDVKTGNSIANVQRGADAEESFDGTLMNKVHQGAITGLTVSNINGNGDGTLLSIGWDDKIRLTDSKSTKSSYKLESQPN